MSPDFAVDHKILIAALVAVLGIVTTEYTGHRGFFAFDQSILFDAGYRVASGQVLYRDFVAPAGPVVILLQGIVFSFFGVSYAAYVATAAVENAIAAVCVFVLLRRLFPESRLWSTVGAVLTALWFYPLFGTPWFENTSYLFGLVGLMFIVPKGTGEKAERRWQAFTAGIAGGLAFLCKQNAGGAVLMGLLAVLAATKLLRGDWPTSLLAFLGGAVGTIGCFIAWVAIFADLDLFVRSFWQIPVSVGRDRLGLISLGPIFFGKKSLIVLTCIVCAGASVLFAFRKLDNIDFRRQFIAFIVVVGASVVQILTMLTTSNSDANTQIYMGLILGGAAASVTSVIRALASPSSEVRSGLLQLHRVLSVGVASFFFLLALVTGGYALRAGMNREVHDIFAGASFSRHCNVPLLGEITWAHPTAYDGVELRCEDMEAVYRAVLGSGTNVFVLGEMTIFYAMTNRPSVSPLLWLHRGLTYPTAYDATMDRWIVDRLEEERVGIVVVETKQFFSTAESQLEYFVELNRYLNSHFIPAERFGLFQLWRRK